jgi:VWFA-related protein
MRTRLLRLALIPVLLSAQAPAPEKEVVLAPAPAPTLRITVTLVQVDAVVTDSRGRHVPDLRPEDFEVLQDGTPQPITHFSYVPQPPPAAPAPPPARKALDKLPLGPPPPISTTGVRRAVAIVVDDLALSFESTVRVRDALRRFIEQQMQPGDLVSIVRSGGGVAFLEQFTTDKRMLLEAVETLKWRFSRRCCVGAIKPLAGETVTRQGPEYLDYEGLNLAALGSLGTLETTIRAMRRLPGRKSIVLLSEAMRLDSRVGEAIDRITDLANRCAVSLYAIDPKGLTVDLPGFEAASDPGDSELGGLLETLPGAFDLHAGLEALARRTGGLFFGNQNDIPGLVRTAVDDQLGYYLLGYAPQAGTFEEEGGDGKFHKVTVRVRRPGLRVRWKSGFEGRTDSLVDLEPSAPRTRQEQLIQALVSPFAATAIRTRMTSLFVNTQKSGSFVRTLIHFDAGGVELKKTADGMWTGDVDLVTTAYRGVNQTVLMGQRRQNILIPEELRQQALREGFYYSIDTPMPSPGTFLMRAAVRDGASERLGSASQVVVVPDIRKGQLAMSSIELRQAPPEIMAKLKRTPQNSDNSPWAEGGPALRRFLPGHSLLYHFVVINPKLKGRAKTMKVEAFVRLFRNGEAIFTSALQPLQDSSRRDDRHIAGAGVVHLPRGFQPGEYLMQIVVIDRNGKKGKASVGNWIDFEVRQPSRVAAAATAAPAQ